MFGMEQRSKESHMSFCFCFSKEWHHYCNIVMDCLVWKSQDIYLIVLAAGEISPRFDLSFLFYGKERSSIQGDHAILQQHLYSFLVGRMSQVICWWCCFRWADSDFTDLQKHNCVDRNRRPAMTFFEKSKQAIKARRRELNSTRLASQDKTRNSPEFVWEPS